MKYKFNIGSRVRVLDGQNIPDYTGGWNSDMRKYINRTAIVIKQLDVYDPYPSYKLQFVDYFSAMHFLSDPFVWDERSLELIDSASSYNTSTKVKDNTDTTANRINKGEIAAFVKDLRAMCDSWDGHCEYCPLGDVESWNCKGEMLSHNFDIESAVAAVESYREKKRRKPCPEAIDKALDIYTIKVMVERNVVAANLPVRTLAQGAMNTLRRFYSDLWVDATIRLLSAKRLISEDQEDTSGEAIDIYIIEIEIVRGAFLADTYTAMCFAEEVKSELLYNHYKKAGRTAFIDILSAKRFVLESHREDNK